MGGISASTMDTTPGRNSLLHWAATYGDAATTQLLLEHGAEVYSVAKLSKQFFKIAFWFAPKELLSLIKKPQFVNTFFR
jgi:ankyrin repeat protein